MGIVCQFTLILYGAWVRYDEGRFSVRSPLVEKSMSLFINHYYYLLQLESMPDIHFTLFNLNMVNYISLVYVSLIPI